MKVTFQMAKHATDRGDKIVSVEGVDMHYAASIETFLKSVLKSAQVIWPEELKGLYIGKTPMKKKKDNQNANRT